MINDDEVPELKRTRKIIIVNWDTLSDNEHKEKSGKTTSEETLEEKKEEQESKEPKNKK